MDGSIFKKLVAEAVPGKSAEAEQEVMMEAPKMIWIGAEWQAERDHYGLDKRCGMFSVNRLYEDDKGYVPADLVRELLEKGTDLVDVLDKITHPAFVGYAKIEAFRAALAALKAMEG